MLTALSPRAQRITINVMLALVVANIALSTFNTIEARRQGAARRMELCQQIESIKTSQRNLVTEQTKPISPAEFERLNLRSFNLTYPEYVALQQHNRSELLSRIPSKPTDLCG